MMYLKVGRGSLIKKLLITRRKGTRFILTVSNSLWVHHRNCSVQEPIIVDNILTNLYNETT